MNYGLWYRQVDGVRLEGFKNVDWAGSSTNGKSSLGCIFSIVSTTISWYNKT